MSTRRHRATIFMIAKRVPRAVNYHLCLLDKFLGVYWCVPLIYIWNTLNLAHSSHAPLLCRCFVFAHRPKGGMSSSWSLSWPMKNGVPSLRSCTYTYTIPHRYVGAHTHFLSNRHRAHRCDCNVSTRDFWSFLETKRRYFCTECTVRKSRPLIFLIAMCEISIPIQNQM